MEIEAAGLVEYNFVDPPTRDVTMAPANGCQVLRVFFDNPGFMTAHCHIEPHSAAGMLVVFKVGTDEEIQQYPLKNHMYEPIANNRCADE